MPKSLLERLEEKFVVDHKTGCWIWNGATSNHRNKWVYGLVSLKGKLVMAHRAMYELKIGKIGNDLQLDHLCRNTRCINPAHLDPVTPKVNINRGERYESSKTLCDHGHKLQGSNLYVDTHGHRECRICRAAQWQAFRERHGLNYVSKEERRRNHVNTTFIEYDGEHVPLKTLAERFGIPYATVKTRFRKGVPVNELFNLQRRRKTEGATA